MEKGKHEIHIYLGNGSFITFPGIWWFLIDYISTFWVYGLSFATIQIYNLGTKLQRDMLMTSMNPSPQQISYNSIYYVWKF